MIFGINPASTDAHTKYVNQKDFNFPLLSDPEREAANKYHALKDNEKGIQRTVYIISKEGKIIFAERGMPFDDKLLEVIRSARSIQ